MNKITMQSVRPYDIVLGDELRHDTLNRLKPFNFQKIAIITDEHVAPLYLHDVKSQLESEYTVVDYVIPAGESSKSMAQFEAILSFLNRHHFDRHSAIIALGGGVVGDLAGYVAASYMRGIGFVQMPTTILAHDSSVGGKVAINLDDIKNLVGHFYPPHIVLYDCSTLMTLNDQEWRSGFAEIIKHRYLKPDMLSQLLYHVQSFDELTTKDLEIILGQSIAVKQTIVEADEHEQSIRQHLNLGHTLAHAIESVFADQQVTHGEAVMVGLLFDLYLSDRIHNRRYPYLTDDFLNWLTDLGYHLTLHYWPIQQLIDAMAHDKKNKSGQITCIVLDEHGIPYAKQFSDNEIAQHLHDFTDELRRYTYLRPLI
ncbi:3-dehydroquinate synthase [Alkalibacillus flavidus]|uniref:3-dehydroquinate synthase n=1 Tax=Alkalibacillus flavidus TaxID=546021 RepID=A0ABV2KRX5_9BACI